MSVLTEYKVQAIEDAWLRAALSAEAQRRRSLFGWCATRVVNGGVDIDLISMKHQNDPVREGEAAILTAVVEQVKREFQKAELQALFSGTVAVDVVGQWTDEEGREKDYAEATFQTSTFQFRNPKFE